MTAPFSLPRSTPESQGISSSAICDFVDAVHEQEIELHSLMVLRHGSVIAEGWWSPYSADRIHLLYSLSKSFTSTAIGLAVNEGLLAVDDLVKSFFPDKLPADLSPYFDEMQVHHILCMGTGHKEDALDRMIRANHEDWVAGFFTIPPDQAPGSIFAYNNAATFMQSAIVQKVTGMKLIDYLEPRLFEPLGITQKQWFENPQGINQGFSGLHITTESIAKMGQLYLQKGEWQGQQLIPESWVERATTYHIDNRGPEADEKPDWAQGYGYQFWQCQHNAYRGDGAFGQFCVVMPEHDAVFVTTSGNDDMQAILNLLWRKLLPAFETSTLPEDASTNQALTATLDGLAMVPPSGESSSPLVSAIDSQTYGFEPEPDEGGLQSITFTFQADHLVLAVADGNGDHQLESGYGEWRLGQTTFYAPGDVPIASGYGWTSPDELTVAIRFVESPHAVTLTFRFEGEQVKVGGQWNVQFGETELPDVIGQRRGSD